MKFQVYKIHSDFYYVKSSDKTEYVCKLREILKKQKIDIRVGDFVSLSEDFNFITSLVKRKNFLNRPKVANIDLALVVCAIKEPDLDLIQLDRYLTYLKYYNIEAAICFNKEDLETDLNRFKDKIKKIYEKLNYKLFFISAKDKLDLDDLKKYIKDKNIVLTGLSGVGKSTLINALSTDFSLLTNSVSKKTKRGVHTTRHVEIMDFDDFKITDTPGFSCLKFDFILPNELINLFDDLKIYKDNCKFSNCLHNTDTKGVCSIYDNLDKIDKSRYESYLTFLKEALEYKEMISKKSIKEENFNKKTGNKVLVKISKRKRESARNTINQKIGDKNEYS